MITYVFMYAAKCSMLSTEEMWKTKIREIESRTTWGLKDGTTISLSLLSSEKKSDIYDTKIKKHKYIRREQEQIGIWE